MVWVSWKKKNHRGTVPKRTNGYSCKHQQMFSVINGWRPSVEHQVHLWWVSSWEDWDVELGWSISSCRRSITRLLNFEYTFFSSSQLWFNGHTRLIICASHHSEMWMNGWAACCILMTSKFSSCAWVLRTYRRHCLVKGTSSSLVHVPVSISRSDWSCWNPEITVRSLLRLTVWMPDFAAAAGLSSDNNRNAVSCFQHILNIWNVFTSV